MGNKSKKKRGKREKNKAKLPLAAGEKMLQVEKNTEGLNLLLVEAKPTENESNGKVVVKQEEGVSSKGYANTRPFFSHMAKLSKPVICFDPYIVYEFKPELCPRFPEKRETLSLDAGFSQTPVLQKILRYYDFKASPYYIAREKTSFSLGRDLSTISVNNLEVVSSRIAPSVVAVSTFFGLERKFDCTGLIIHWSSSEKEATILTSAKLLYNPKDSEFEFHLIVRMADGTLLLAKEEYVDYSYNLLSIKVKPMVEPKVVDLISGQDLVDGMKVISLSRSFFTTAFYSSVGKLCEYPPSFGCSELLTTDCGIPEIGEGGPLVTDEGYVVGIDFFGLDHCAHPLPISTVLSCLEMWKSFSSVVRPWFGIGVYDVNQACKLLSIPAKKVTELNRDSYVLVEKVYEGSVASKNNIKSGASVATLNGTRIESVKEVF
uniref:PDZ domain-containing protein n=1 Tax=Daucus carota subsp. sativus TaxID=79200 RepID=A0A164XCM1_DAUCS